MMGIRVFKPTRQHVFARRLSPRLGPLSQESRHRQWRPSLPTKTQWGSPRAAPPNWSMRAREPQIWEFDHCFRGRPTSRNEPSISRGKYKEARGPTHAASKRVLRALHCSRIPMPTLTPCASRVVIALFLVSGGPGSLSWGTSSVNWGHQVYWRLASSSSPITQGTAWMVSGSPRSLPRPDVQPVNVLQRRQPRSA